MGASHRMWLRTVGMAWGGHALNAPTVPSDKRCLVIRLESPVLFGVTFRTSFDDTDSASVPPVLRYCLPLDTS